MKQLLLNQRLMLVAGLVLSALASCTTFGAVTAFSEVFKSFGGDLPPVTRLIPGSILLCSSCRLQLFLLGAYGHDVNIEV